jgi:hypothetical protein
MTDKVSAAKSGRWLRLARAAWLFALVLGLALLVPNLGGQLNQFQIVCSGPACGILQLSPTQAADLSRLGLSLPLVAGYLTALSALQALAFVAIAAVIFWRKSDDRLALFMSFALVTFGIGNVLDVNTPPATAAQILMLLFQATGRASLVLLLFLFPDGRFVPSWTRWLAPFVAAREVVGAFLPGSIIDSLFFVVAPLVLLMQVYRYRRSSNAVQRQQTKWVVFGSVLGVGTYASLMLLFIVVSARVGPPDALSTILLLTGASLGLTFIPISVGMAILRSHLWDIDVIIRRTLVYSALTALLALVYFGSVVALQALFTALTGAARSELVTVVSTLAIAALFVPLRRWLQAFIDRRFYRRKYDAARTLAAFSAAARDEVNLDDLTERMVSVVDSALRPAQISLWLPTPSGGAGLARGGMGAARPAASDAVDAGQR